MEGYVTALIIFFAITICAYGLATAFGIIALDCICRQCCPSPVPTASDELNNLSPGQVTNNGVINENVFDKYVDDHI
jgi:hypothetical protein